MAEERFVRGARGLHRVLLRAERFAYTASDVTLAMNESFRAIAIERGHLAPEDVVIVRNGPRLARFVPLPPDPSLKRGREHLVVYVGLMNPLDGVDHALHALAHLRRRRHDWHAILLGDGEAFDELQALAAELGLADRVEFPGFVDDVTLRRAICSADVCLAPDPRSRLTEASTMVKIAEYMTMGRPIATYDLRETRVTAGPAAVYADGDEPAALAAAVDRLLDAPALREEMGRLARERVERRFAWEHSEPALLAAYERAIAKARRPAGPSRAAAAHGHQPAPTTSSSAIPVTTTTSS
jgi:glycosyltransferase involved in cell wall biosynthesis